MPRSSARCSRACGCAAEWHFHGGFLVGGVGPGRPPREEPQERRHRVLTAVEPLSERHDEQAGDRKRDSIAMTDVASKTVRNSRMMIAT